jgi:hypothetical protein
VAAQPYGPWLLSLMALGLMCFTRVPQLRRRIVRGFGD